MIPILGETVLSIIHGPATTSHIFELSQFLRRPINVWAKDRLLLFGRCHHRHKPRLHLKYGSRPPARRRGGECTRCGGRPSSTSSAGHFSLLEGHEPRNPDARSHPENCGFDVVSDQTGYPASVLRQVVAQRMLVKLYESRLRGRDHHFQCSRCSLSGGRFWLSKDAKELIQDSRDNYSGHAHMHVYRESCDRQCACSATGSLKKDGGLKSIKCMDKYLQINNDGKETTKTLFECDRDLFDCLAKVMNGEPAKAAKKCFEEEHDRSCAEYPGIDRHRASIVTYVGELERRAYSFTWDKERNRTTDFYFKIKSVRTILKSRYTGKIYIVSRVLYVETMWPIRDKAEKPLQTPERMIRVFRPALREQQQTSNSSSTPNKQKIASNSSLLSPTSNQLPSGKPPLPPRKNQPTPCKQKIASNTLLSPYSKWVGVKSTSSQPESGGPSKTADQMSPTTLRSASKPTSSQGSSATSGQPTRERRSEPAPGKQAQSRSGHTRRSWQGQAESGGQKTTADKMSPTTLCSASKPTSSQGSSARAGQPTRGRRSEPAPGKQAQSRSGHTRRSWQGQAESGGQKTTADQMTPTTLRSASKPTSSQGSSARAGQPTRGRRSEPAPGKQTPSHSGPTRRSLQGQPESGGQKTTPRESADASKSIPLYKGVRQLLGKNNNRQNNTLDEPEPTQRKQPKRTTK